MIIVLLILFVAFLAGAISEGEGFSWGSFIFVFIFGFFIFVGLSYVTVYDQEGYVEPYIDGKVDLEKIITEDREIYLAVVYENESVGHIVKTDGGFIFLTNKCKLEIIEDGSNYIIAHTQTVGGFWWALFFSREIIDHYEVHIPRGYIMYRGAAN